MNVFVWIVAICLATAYVTAQDEVTKDDSVPDNEADENDQAFISNVEEHADEKEGKTRTRRSVSADLDLLTPARGLLGSRHNDEFRPYASPRESLYDALRRPSSLLLPRPDGKADLPSFGLLSGSALARSGLLRAPAPALALPGPRDSYRYYYYAPGTRPRPAFVAAAADGYYYYDGAGYPAATAALTGAGFAASEDGVTEWSFLNFYNSFRPLQALKTEDNVFVRNYFRYGSFDDCMSDFWRLQLKDVRSLDSAAVLGDRDFRLLSGVAAGASSYLANLPRQAAVGLVGLMRDYPYKVVALRSGCQLDGFNGYHDCIIFSGATEPYANTVRRFVYVQEQQQQQRLTAIRGGYNLPAELRPAQIYQPGRVRGPALSRPVDVALALQ